MMYNLPLGLKVVSNAILIMIAIFVYNFMVEYNYGCFTRPLNAPSIGSIVDVIVLVSVASLSIKDRLMIPALTNGELLIYWLLLEFRSKYVIWKGETR